MINKDKTNLELVKEFMKVGNQTINENPTEILTELNKLRIALLFEEVKEYAEASGELEYFNLLCMNSVQDFQETYLDEDTCYVPFINEVEQLDALVDIDYILKGTVITHGFGNFIDEAFEAVNDSNMSKFCTTVEEAQLTVDDYTKRNINTYYKQVDDFYVVYRKEDNKILKSINYKAVDLKPIIKITK